MNSRGLCFQVTFSLSLCFFAAELQKQHEQEKSQLTEKFQAAENVLKVKNKTTQTH